MIALFERISALTDDKGKLSSKRLFLVIIAGLLLLLGLSVLTNLFDSRAIRTTGIILIIVDLSMMMAAAKALGDLKFNAK
jgi:uncharacterized membrane protein HdeD (DUF308 family)